MTYYKAPPNKPRPSPELNPMQAVLVHLPNDVFEYIKKYSFSHAIPMSRLIAQAVDNELDTATPFNYPCPWPSTAFVADAYANEAGRLFRWMEKYNRGMDVETIVMCRREFDIPSREVVMLALRELENMGFIEKFSPKKATFQYGRGYKRYRIVRPDPREIKQQLKDKRRVNGKDLEVEDGRAQTEEE